MDVKWCNFGQHEVPVSEFGKNKSKASGLQNYCKPCMKKYAQKWNKDNREHVNQKAKDWREANPEKSKQIYRDYYSRNSEARKELSHRLRFQNHEARLAYDCQYYRDNRERRLAENAQWRKDHPEFDRAKNAARRGVPYTEEALDYIDIFKFDPCVYCGGEAVSVDHINPISKGGSGDWDNLAPACHSCNSRKNNKDLLGFLLSSMKGSD